MSSWQYFFDTLKVNIMCTGQPHSPTHNTIENEFQFSLKLISVMHTKAKLRLFFICRYKKCKV